MANECAPKQIFFALESRSLANAKTALLRPISHLPNIFHNILPFSTAITA